MKKFFKDKINNIFRDQGLKAGIVPVENPENEDHRLAEVQRLGVLDRDLSGERRYNSMIQLASYLTGCEHSMINILDADIQQCKASFGLNMLRKTMMEEMPREISICQFSLTNPSQPLVIENLMEDDRTKNFSNLPGAPNFNFYAGSPLISSRGFSIGTLCVLDPSPKSLAHKQVEGLRLLSDQVAGMLENEADSSGSKEGEDNQAEDQGKLEGQYYSAVSILFADFVGFTKMVETTEPGELLETLNTFFMGFDKIIAKHNVLKVKTIGDCYMCVGGIPGQQKTHAHEVCSAARDMLQFVEGTNIQHEVVGRPPWEVRIGIHSGPVIAGTSGDAFDIWGDAVNIAARIESSGETGKIHITEKTADYLEGAAKLTPRGEVSLKNKGGWSTFFLEDLT
ncbi:MAG: adenylate/guanylate cyclase domain-containing protein [Candidatus Neomarinimicrobiota bacterium]|nr:adenylate/guanylate cyclase domain-containing protein [Candidatus Neomarinimicrobiota bacterium]